MFVACTIQSPRISFTLTNNMSRKAFIFTILTVFALFFDIIFGTARVPIFALMVCGIVIIYEVVSPHIYT